MSFDIFTAFATDENLEANGTLFPLGGGKLLIARAQNRRFQRAIGKAVEARKVELDLAGPDASDEVNNAAEAVSDEIMIDVMARTILLGWEGDLSFKGELLGEYTVEKAKKLLAIKEFRKLVSDLSNRMEAFKVKAEVASGNA